MLGLFEPVAGAVTPPTGCAVIYPTQGLTAGQSFASCDGRFELTLTTDGRLLLKQASIQLWAAPATAGTNSTAVLTIDGHLVLSTSAGHQVWSAAGGHYPGAHLQIQDDGNLVLLNAQGQPV